MRMCSIYRNELLENVNENVFRLENEVLEVTMCSVYRNEVLEDVNRNVFRFYIVIFSVRLDRA
jgi:hypothetical protein